MPGVYKLKKCKYEKCGKIHRQRGPYCSQSCSNYGRDDDTKKRVSESIRKTANEFNTWYKNLSHEKKIEFQETKESKKLTKELKGIIKNCQDIIDNIEFDLNNYNEKYRNNPANPQLIKLIYSACPPNYEVDHIVPKARGGPDHQDNFQYLFWEDNIKKSKKLESEITFTLRKIDWRNAIEEKNGEFYIKEEWVKEVINKHPLVTLPIRVSRTSNLISEIVQSSNRPVKKPAKNLS